MRLGRIFTEAAKGKSPDPGTFRFVENASDPMAGTAAAAPSPFPPSDGGDGTLFASGWGGGDGKVWPNSGADADTGADLEENNAGFSSGSSGGGGGCEQDAAGGSCYSRGGSFAGGSCGSEPGSGSGGGWAAADRSGGDGGFGRLVDGGGTGGVSRLTPHAPAYSGVSGMGVGREQDFPGGSARQSVVGDGGMGGERFGVPGEAWRDTCHGGEGERPTVYVPEHTPGE